MVLKKTYKANTLPEVLIAIVIITVTSTIGMIIYLNIQQNTQPFIKLKANEIANTYLQKSLLTEDYFDNQYKEEEFSIKKSIQRSAYYPDCIILKITVSTIQQPKLSEIEKIIYVP